MEKAYNYIGKSDLWIIFDMLYVCFNWKRVIMQLPNTHWIYDDDDDEQKKILYLEIGIWGFFFVRIGDMKWFSSP